MVQRSEKSDQERIDKLLEEVERERGCIGRSTSSQADSTASERTQHVKKTVQKQAKRDRYRRQGRRNRQRGYETENSIYNALKDIGGTRLEKSREYHKGRVWDIACTLGLSRLYLQIKRRKTIPKWIQQILKSMKKKKLNVLYLKIDYHDGCIFMSWKDFLKLLKKSPIGHEKKGMDDYV